MPTLLLYQPAAFGLVEGAPLSVGAFLSILMPETVVLELLSALSTAVRETDWLAPLVVTVEDVGQLLMPERLSEQVKLTVTSELFHPLAFAVGLRLPLIVGAVLSSFTVTEPLPVLPRRSVAVEILVTESPRTDLRDRGQPGWPGARWVRSSDRPRDWIALPPTRSPEPPDWAMEVAKVRGARFTGGLCET
jgi:hypothetical protein